MADLKQRAKRSRQACQVLQNPTGAYDEIQKLRLQLERAEARVAELTEMFAQGFDADGDLDEWRARAMKSVAGGLPSANAFIKRKQAEAIQDWLHGNGDMGGLDDYAQRLRQQADEAEKEPQPEGAPS